MDNNIPQEESNSINEIKNSLENLLNSKTVVLKSRRNTKEDKEKQVFEKLILTLEELKVRSFILEEDIKIGISSYDEKFYEVIDMLLKMHFNTQITDLIMFYLYDRVNPDGSINTIMDDKNRQIPLNSPDDLWNLIQILKKSKAK